MNKKNIANTIIYFLFILPSYSFIFNRPHNILHFNRLIMKNGFLLGAHHGMTLDDVDHVCNKVKEFFNA